MGTRDFVTFTVNGEEARRKVNPRPVPSLGKRETHAFVDWHDKTTGEMRGDFRPVSVDVYPTSPCGEALRHLRVLAGLGLRETAAMLGLSAVDLSALERGSATLTDAEWVDVFQAIRDRARPPKEFVP